MPYTVSAVREPPAAAPNRKRWSRDECDALQGYGMLQGRYELLDGEILTKMGQNPPHATVIGLLNVWLGEVFGQTRVRIQVPIDVAPDDRFYNEPEPDAAVTGEPTPAYAARHPGEGDVMLLAEVADSTLDTDLTRKAPLYARAGFPDYWVVDINGRRIVAHRKPVDGIYTEVLEYAAHERIAPLAQPNAAIRVEDLLPPA